MKLSDKLYILLILASITVTSILCGNIFVGIIAGVYSLAVTLPIYVFSRALHKLKDKE